MKKIIPINDIERLVRKLRRENKTIVTTNGCFDLLHVGHVRNLQGAKKLGDVLIVALNSDSSVRNYKGERRPIITARDRAEMLSALPEVDYICIFGSKTPVPLLKKIKPNVHVKGSDRTVDELPEKELIESLGGMIVLFPHTGRHSTTSIINKILRPKK